MTRSARYWRSHPLLLVVLLAALMARGLIPAGFMPVVGEGFSFSLQLCPAQVPGAASMGQAGTSHEQHAHHHGMQTGEGAASANHDHSGSDSTPPHESPCLFAASLFTAPPPAAPALDTSGADRIVQAVVAGSQTPAGRAVVRAQTPRAPPHLS